MLQKGGKAKWLSRIVIHKLYVYIYISMVPPHPHPLTYHFASFETQGWVGAGGSGMERRPENAIFLGLSLFRSSQRFNLLRGLNLFVILQQNCWEAPKDSILWRSWETVPQNQKD